ncbi:MAG: class I SAM-dependent methyltransferase [Acidobacteria bacterium]|nr:class I SAM-dependent methyltransferase [Acidobacteriota bacterium]
MSLLIDEHREYLHDRARLAVFERAIHEVVRPGAVVADLGCGTGILGLMACRAGASRVYAVDDSGMVGQARQIARDNGFADRITFIDGHSTRVVLPERVDAIISDVIGRIGFLQGGAESLIDARERWLRPGGSIMPAVVHTWAAPVEHAALYGNVDFWRQPVVGFDVSAVREAAASTGYPHAFAPSDLLADGVPVLACDYQSGPADVARGEVTFTVSRPGTLHGIAAWFTAQLSPAVVATNAPGAEGRIARRHAFLPLESPVAVEAGDLVLLSLVIRPADFIVAWSVRCLRDGQERAAFRQSTLRGMLLVRQDFVGAAEDATPTLNVWAAARATVLALCDGQRTVRDIERGVFDQHRSLFSTEAHAQVFVAEVISRYADVPPPRA